MPDEQTINRLLVVKEQLESIAGSTKEALIVLEAELERLRAEAAE